VSDNDPECTICVGEVNKWGNIKKSQREQIDNHEAFFKDLEHTKDGFSVIANAFGRPLT